MAEETGVNEMNVIIVGPGAIGCGAAATIGDNDHTVYLLGREYHKEHFSKKPVFYKVGDKTISAKINPIIMDDLKGGFIKPDAILITLKANSTMALVKEMEEYLPSETPLISLQNGFIAQDIFDNTSFNNVFACVVGFNSVLEDTGVAIQTTDGDMIVGKIKSENTENTKDDIPGFILDLLNHLIETKVSQNIISDVWMKVMINSTINPICAIGNLTLGELGIYEPGLKLGLWTWRELVHVVDALKLRLNPFQGILHPEMLYVYDIVSYGIARMVIWKMTGDNKDAVVSMLQDVRSGRSTEIDYLNGKIFEIGSEYGIEMPVNQILIDTIKQIERGELKPSKGLLNKLYRDYIMK
ncbi:MAG: ketopantoate reductase family protein [Candidatus Heimdallarchaeota archaeon]|nr:ketopantoate reductase family protein [Candidatus Heimdallarchaeota archaeon]